MSGDHLPEPRLTRVYRLEATLGEPLDLGDVAQGHRRIVPQTGGTFTGPELHGKLLPGASADWQIVLPDGTALGDIRYTLQTDAGELLYVQSRGVRHGSAEVLARLGRGEDVDASEYTFRTSTQIEATASQLDWLNKGVFISVGGRQADLGSPEFFDVELYREIHFRSTSLRREGDNLTVDGELTIKGNTRAVEGRGTIDGPAVTVGDAIKLGVVLETVVDRTEFGLNW